MMSGFIVSPLWQKEVLIFLSGNFPVISICTNFAMQQTTFPYMKHFSTTATVALAALCLASCGSEKFRVEGNITGAKDSTLYFENIGVDGITKLDSVKLDDEGSFKFSGDRTEAPEFYRLRVGGQIINVAIDSTETVRIKADYTTMATAYEVEGSEECSRIKELALMQIDLQNKVMAIQSNAGIGETEASDSIMAMVAVYKDDVKNRFIYKDPKAASSYFALFQTLGGNWLIFNPRNSRDDIRAFAAVATSWDTFYPGAVRGENLHNIAISGMKNERIAEAKAAPMQIDSKKVVTAGLIDICLDDNKGRQRSLNQLKGKVVMLDFHLFGTKDSPARILSLRELYTKYHSHGFEIYQIALNGDEHYWKQQTATLPWICVRDPQGIDSHNVSIYNVKALPEYFLIDRDNNLVSRSEQIEDLDKAIEALL